MSSLSIRNLEVHFLGESEDTIAVRQASFDIVKGEILGLVGESGCGKSTIIHSILRSLPPPGVICSGSIIFKGKDICKMSKNSGLKMRWNTISLVVQSALSALSPVNKVGDHFEDTLLAHTKLDSNKRLEKSKATLKRVQLSPTVLEMYPHQLSGGMQQRVVIALAILLEPELIIFDEPTTALDCIIEAQIITEIKRLQSELNFTALFVSHDLNVVQGIADRIAVMLDGEIVEILDNEVFHDAKHPYTQQLLSSLHIPPFNLHKEETTRTPSLSLNNVTKIFKLPTHTTTALQNVSFTISQGESIAIVGESGSGKSTIGKIIAGVLTPTSGTVHWHNQPVKSQWQRLSQTWFNSKPSPAQIIFQNPFSALNPTQTIRQNLSGACQTLKLTKSETTKKIEHCCELVGLTPPKKYLTSFPHELSGGQKQRVCIARALLCEPKVLICDEPTSMLDLNLRYEILKVLNQLHTKQGISLIFITHDLSAAKIIAERILICHQGQIIEDGTVNQIFLDPLHDYTKSLISAKEQT
jgi:peptide/nickel transport system ATP-binding protein